MRLKIGAIIEIPTSRGFAYAQYTHRNPIYGDLIRIIAGFHPLTPHNLDCVAKMPHSFVAFFPLGAAIQRKIFKIVGFQPVPDFATNFPIFKSSWRHPKTNEVTTWFLWDGEKEWKVDQLSEEEKKYPICSIWNDTLLIQRIEEGWLPEHDL